MCSGQWLPCWTHSLGHSFSSFLLSSTPELSLSCGCFSCITYKHPSIVFKTSTKALSSLLVSKMHSCSLPITVCDGSYTFTSVTVTRVSGAGRAGQDYLLLSWSIWTALTKYCNMSGLPTTDTYSPSHGDSVSKIKCSMVRVEFSPGYEQLASPCILTCWNKLLVLHPLVRAPSRHEGSSPNVSSKLNHFPKVPPPNSIMLGISFNICLWRRTKTV